MDLRTRAIQALLEGTQAIPYIEPAATSTTVPAPHYVVSILPAEIREHFRSLLNARRVCFMRKVFTYTEDAGRTRYVVEYYLKDNETGMHATHWVWKVKVNNWENTVTFQRFYPFECGRDFHAWHQAEACIDLGRAVYTSLRYTLTGNTPPSVMPGCTPVAVEETSSEP